MLRHVKEVGLYAVEVGEELIFITLYSDHWKWYLYLLEHYPFFELEKYKILSSYNFEVLSIVITRL